MVEELQRAWVFWKCYGTVVTTESANEVFNRTIAKIKADAWDEGAMDMLNVMCAVPACGDCNGCEAELVNPYKTK
jgi:hypothetical protein